mmetsp:Transcript_768/g.1259  ORF Transcript_768/g.1259 Transcript_768/m.1259 type:complete len:88 (+) Transcript_768:338-601(+)
MSLFGPRPGAAGLGNNGLDPPMMALEEIEGEKEENQRENELSLFGIKEIILFGWGGGLGELRTGSSNDGFAGNRMRKRGKFEEKEGN